MRCSAGTVFWGLLLFPVAHADVLSPVYEAPVVRVYDGDTFWVKGKDVRGIGGRRIVLSEEIPIRIRGIDTPRDSIAV